MVIAEPSAKSLLIQLVSIGNVLAAGTAFVGMSPSNHPILITNRHNLTGRRQDDNQLLSPTGAVPDTVRILHNRLDHLGEWVFRDEPLYAGGRETWIEHPTLGPNADLAALPLTNLDDVQVYPYSLGVGDPPIACGPAEIVSVVGFPFGLQGGGSLAIWATGFVASEPAVDYSGLPQFLIDCRSRPGQSGSAVIAHRSGGAVQHEGGITVMMAGPSYRFLGIYSGRINNESDLGLVWKASALVELAQASP